MNLGIKSLESQREVTSSVLQVGGWEAEEKHFFLEIAAILAGSLTTSVESSMGP